METVSVKPKEGNIPSNTNIDIYLRVRPIPKPSPHLHVKTLENKIDFTIPRDLTLGYVNNQRERYEFVFSGVMAAEAKQDEVFEKVARSVVMGALEGRNGTVFAYGQTGSGKTFTVTGGPERYVDRGIIPRSISTIFSEVAKRSEFTHTVQISYLEIYNEVGYDLLDPTREVKMLEDLPRVHLMEDEDANIHLRNLTIHNVNTEEDALNLLFLGDTNRTISETPMNMASSRSHCIFTIHVEARKAGDDVVRRSKLNLVDLAGSERVSKTNIDGTILREAKYINLSLHYLEQVIIALQERSMGQVRPHVPYRNSMMTQVLRDSLGGNCRTVMIANITSQAEHLDESISTCRFAQRVAMVSNQVVVNEEVDPNLVVKRLRQEVRDLKEEIRLLKGEDEERGPLTPDEVSRIKGQVEAWLQDTSPDAQLNLGGSMLLIRAAFHILKDIVREGGANGAGAGKGVPEAVQEDLRRLRLQVQQRDNEINILVSMLKKREAGRPEIALTASSSGSAAIAPLPPAAGRAADAAPSTTGRVSNGGDAESIASTSAAARSGAGTGPDPLPPLLDVSVLADRSKAFELFRKSYRKNEVIEENKALLKAKYQQAKDCGAQVNESKARINQLKALIEQRRIQRAMADGGAAGGSKAEQEPDPEEERAKAQIEKEKASYKAAFATLRGLKSEIEHLQMLLEQSRGKLQKDFEQWLTLMARQQGTNGSPAAAAVPGTAAAVPGMRAATGDVAVGSRPAAEGGGGGAPVERSLRQIYSGIPAGASEAAARMGPLRSVSDSSGTGSAVRAATERYQQQRGSPRSSLGLAAAATPRASTGAPMLLSEDGTPLVVDPDVMKAAAPHLTGNATADGHIIKFYEAKQSLHRTSSQTSNGA